MVLDTFALISNIIPFFGYTDQAFILLSCLCRKTRDLLDEYYVAFRLIMTENWYTIEISEENYNNFLLPWDLFKFKFSFDIFPSLGVILFKFATKIYEK